MAQPFIGEIRLFPYNNVPPDWMACEGQLLQTMQYQALFTLLGTTYGGDGRTNFALPDLRGRVPVQYGAIFPIGNKGGEETHKLTVSEIPTHIHFVTATTALPTRTNVAPTNTFAGVIPPSFGPVQSQATFSMSPSAISPAGNSQPHQNMQPYLAVAFCIALKGIYPSVN